MMLELSPNRGTRQAASSYVEVRTALVASPLPERSGPCAVCNRVLPSWLSCSIVSALTTADTHRNPRADSAPPSWRKGIFH